MFLGSEHGRGGLLGLEHPLRQLTGCLKLSSVVR